MNELALFAGAGLIPLHVSGKITGMDQGLIMDKRRNPQAEQMYEDYKSGMSLEEVGKAYGITRQSVYGLFKYRGWETRPKRRPLPFMMFGGERYTIYKEGYYRKTRGNRSLMHRDVWEAHKGPIPDGWDIHHLNEDKEDNRIENLECLPKAEHTRRYSPHNNQHTKGRKRR